jgi:hypothetical protein
MPEDAIRKTRGGNVFPRRIVERLGAIQGVTNGSGGPKPALTRSDLSPRSTSEMSVPSLVISPNFSAYLKTLRLAQKG